MKKFIITLIFLLLTSTVFAESNKKIEVDLPLKFISVSHEKTDKKQVTLLHTNEQTNNSSRVYIKINLDKLPSSILINHAFLNIKSSKCTGNKTNITVAKISSIWDIDTVTWSNKPGFSTPITNLDFDCKNKTLTFDVSKLIKILYLNKDNNNGLVLFGDGETRPHNYTRDFEVYDKETYLRVQYNLNTASTGIQVITSDINVIGILPIIVIPVAILAIILYILISRRVSNNRKAVKDIKFADKLIDSIKDKPKISK